MLTVRARWSKAGQTHRSGISALEVLLLRGNDLGNFDALESCPRLRYVDVSFNRVRHLPAPSFFEGSPGPAGLETLLCDHNYVSAWEATRASLAMLRDARRICNSFGGGVDVLALVQTPVPEALVFKLEGDALGELEWEGEERRPRAEERPAVERPDTSRARTRELERRVSSLRTRHLDGGQAARGTRDPAHGRDVLKAVPRRVQRHAGVRHAGRDRSNM